ncbi:Dna-J like membrane chaperone protein [compost metagenome]
MSSISHFFDSGEQARHKGHFMNLVMLARADGNVSSEENQLLKKIATKLSLTDEQVAEIYNNPENYPFIPPVTREERYERFIQLIQLMGADGKMDANEAKLVRRLGVELGFTPERIDEKFPIILEHLRKGMNREEVLRIVI